jgi:hypothetical protein
MAIDIKKTAGKILGGKTQWLTILLTFLGGFNTIFTVIVLGLGIVFILAIITLAKGGFGNNPLTQNQTAIAAYGTAGGKLTYPANATPTQVAACLDAWIKKTRSNSPLNGKGITFAQAGQTNNVNPALMISIATLESELGTTGGGPAHHNPFGWGCPPCKNFATWEEGIATITSKMRSNYLNQNLITIPEMGRVWAPVDASNDPNKTNGDWIPAVTQYFNSIISSCPSLTVPN